MDVNNNNKNNCLGIITCILQVRKDLEDPRQLCPPSVLQERGKKAICMQAKYLSLFLKAFGFIGHVSNI